MSIVDKNIIYERKPLQKSQRNITMSNLTNIFTNGNNKLKNKKSIHREIINQRGKNFKIYFDSYQIDNSLFLKDLDLKLS